MPSPLLRSIISWLTYFGQAMYLHILLFPFILAFVMYADYRGWGSEDVL